MDMPVRFSTHAHLLMPTLFNNSRRHLGPVSWLLAGGNKISARSDGSILFLDDQRSWRDLPLTVATVRERLLTDPGISLGGGVCVPLASTFSLRDMLQQHASHTPLVPLCRRSVCAECVLLAHRDLLNSSSFLVFFS